MTSPDVSVVVISYNDAARLPRAIRSVQRQTLRSLEIIVVDDCSSDDTAEVVAALAADDPRIRYERLPENSGGCSAPRNRGMDLARAPWVMFCDSDDEYERHACKNLLEAAERAGADVVCGTAERIDVRTGRARRWRPELHGVARVADSLADLPDLLYDTISVNKIYRTRLLLDAGIRFPEGLLFEDQLFTLEAMTAAGRIAVIPETVYRWYVDRVSEEPSITQRRNEARNVESRIEVNRRIDAFLAEHGDRRLREEKTRKFLRHDLYLYLSSMLEVDDETATLLMDRLHPYVSGLDLRAAWGLRPALRVAVYHLLVRDLEGLRAAMRNVKWASVVDRPILARDDRELWGCRHLDAGPDVGGVAAIDWLDVTDLGIRRIPVTQRRYLHRLDSLTVDGGRLVATGSTVDQVGTLDQSEGVELRVLAGADRTLLSVPATWTGWDGHRRLWRVDGVPHAHPARPLAERDRGTLALAVMQGGLETVTGVRCPDEAAPQVAIPMSGATRRTGPDTLVTGAHENGALGWRAATRSAAHRRAQRWQRAWRAIPGAALLERAVARVRSEWITTWAAHLGRRLPARSIVLVDGGTGRVPLPDVVAAAASFGHREQAWVVPAHPGDAPPGVRLVERGSVRHAWLAARAVLRLEDGATAPAIPRASGRTVVNARVTVPVHRIGLDDPSVLVSRAAVAAHRRRARTWDVLASASPPAGEAVSSALAFDGRRIDVGLPRMDAALRHVAAPGGRDALRQRLDLPADRCVVVHLPAPRELDGPLLDLDAWAADLGSRASLVLAASWSSAGGEAVPTRLRHAVRLLGERDNLAGVIAAADVVVSDYSGHLADAALADRPIVLYQPDRDTYVGRTRGLYPGVDGLGPRVATQGELVAAVLDWQRDPAAWDAAHGPARREWAARLCGPADGHAGRRLAEGVSP